MSSDSDGYVFTWGFDSHSLVCAPLRLPSPATHMFPHRHSGLLALPCEDFALRIIDMGALATATAGGAVVRTFRGARNAISDVAWSGDARWVVFAVLDGGVKLYDVPSARCIDWMVFERPCVSLAFSPGGEFLATAHVGELGISLWAKQSVY